MNILNNQQLSYLKSLDTNEKRKDFVLECIVENAIGESEKINSFFKPSRNHFQDSIELGLQGLNAIRDAYKLRDERKKDEKAIKMPSDYKCASDGFGNTYCVKK